MFCCEKQVQIQPEDYLFKNSHSKSIKIKNEKEIHLIHINETNRLNEIKKTFKLINDSVNSSQIFSEQPRRSNYAEQEDVADFKNPNEINYLKEKNEKNKLEFLNLNHSNFRSLVESDLFNKSTKNNVNHLESNKKYGLSIYYKETFKGNETPKPTNKLPMLFFIHGVGGNSLIWKNQLKYFGNLGFEILSIDLIGHGKSAKSKDKMDYDFVEICSDVRTVFDIYAREENIIIAHSYGCSFAVNLSQERKNLIKKLVLVSGGLPYPLNYSSSILNGPLVFFKMIKPFVDCHFFCSAFSSNYKDKHREAFQISAESLFYTMKGQFWHPSFIKSEYFKKQTVLLIEGSADKFVPFDDAFEMLMTLDNSYLVSIDKGSHMILLEEPDVINRLILLFIEDPIC